MAGLNIVYGLPHISIGDEEKSFEGLFGYFYVLAFDYSLEVQFNLVISEFAESQDNASALNGFDDLGGSVAAQHESSCLAEVADNHSKGVLGSVSQTISFIQDNNFCASWWKGNFLLGERFDLISDNIDSSFI